MYRLFSKYASKGMSDGEFILDCQLDYKNKAIIFTYDKYIRKIYIPTSDFDLLAENESDFVDFALNCI